MSTLMKYSKKISVLLMVMTMLCFVCSTVTQIESHALFDQNSDLQIADDGEVKTSANQNGSAFAKIIDKYKGVITFVSGIGAITMIGIFIFHFMKLGSTAANPSERAKVTTGLIWSGLAAAGLGSVSLIVGVFYGLLK